MSNSARLRTTANPKHELYGEYMLPDGWLLFFAPEDIHVGSACPVPGLCKPTTSSYLLVDAGVGLSRFEARMKAGGISLVGDGMIAKLHRFLLAHFASGWLFADTTELECMTRTFVDDTRRALGQVEADRRYEPTAEGLLMEYGWGSDLSAEEQPPRR
jgi:hypothetical protein